MALVRYRRRLTSGPPNVRRAVVQGFGAEIRHVIDAPEAMFSPWTFDNKHTFEAVQLPLVAICLTRIRSSQKCVKVELYEPATCKRCLKELEKS